MFSGMASFRVVEVVEGAVSIGGASAVGAEGISFGGRGMVVVGVFSSTGLFRENITNNPTANKARTIIRFLYSIFIYF